MQKQRKRCENNCKAFFTQAAKQIFTIESMCEREKNERRLESEDEP